MRTRLYLLLAIFAGLAACTPTHENQSLIKKNIDVASVQFQSMLDHIGDTNLNPGSTRDGSLSLVPSRSWISGFFPGSLWYLYEYTGDEKWLEPAIHFTMNVEQEKFNGGTHDMGFKMFCSFGNGYRLKGNEDYRDILIQSASTLITRFNPTVGCIRSWDHNTDKWDYPVIVDNMMNLELLFWATKETDDPVYFNVALKHAETTLKNHFREDGSSYHVVSYDTLSGEVVKKNTHQGYAHESSWARGQAWGLYGFTMTYRETRDERFLKLAEKIAEFILNHPNLPEDMVPYWDFDAPDIPNTDRDASAAAIMASALYELSTFVGEAKSARFLEAADHILKNLSSPDYLSEPGTNNNFLLMHSVGNHPRGSQVDVPISYADYYFMEANLRKMKLSSE